MEQAIIKYDVELMRKLPLDDVIFFGMAKKARLFPLNTGDHIRAQPTEQKKWHDSSIS